MRILVLSFYYPPDLSAGSFRTDAFVRAILNKHSNGVHIDVITTVPNRYSTFSSAAKEHEENDGLEVFRIKLPLHKSGMWDQSLAFIKFFQNANSIVSEKKYDLIYATSSRLMTAVLGAWITTRIKARLYLDIRDIFVDTINNVLPGKATFFLKPVFSFLEWWAINKADKVNLVSGGFREYFELRYPNQKFSFFTNGIDDEFIESRHINIEKKEKKKLIKVLYAGNFGEGQGLHMVVPMLAKKMQGRVQFVLIGDGGRKSQLKSLLYNAGCKNVELRDPVSRDKLIKAYCESDVLFLHLNDYAAFRKVLPSKIFEYAALGKPIWAGVSGFSAEFIKAEIENAVVFSPCDVNEAANVFENLDVNDMKRPEFISKFTRKNIMELMVNDVLSICKKGT